MLKLAFCRGPLLTLMPFQKNLKVAVMAGWRVVEPLGSDAHILHHSERK
jgi:hypothetical protein